MIKIIKLRLRNLDIFFHVIYHFGLSVRFSYRILLQENFVFFVLGCLFVFMVSPPNFKIAFIIIIIIIIIVESFSQQL